MPYRENVSFNQFDEHNLHSVFVTTFLPIKTDTTRECQCVIPKNNQVFWFNAKLSERLQPESLLCLSFRSP